MKRERYAPLVPSVLLGVSYGGFGGGLGSDITNSDGRFDADAMAYWEVRNLGFGERAARNQTSSVVRQAQWRNVALMDTVAREVVDAHMQVIKRRERIETCRLGVVAARRSFDLNLDRIRNAQGLPIEVLQSIQALRVAQRTFLNAVVDYNQSQFQLCHATGWFIEGA
jgi:outer membrane protein TolC